ncbi:MAG: L-Ala-D/L-Glu epimerase [Gaiellaceae bacterium]|nr:L-Ala-D/L-Glu epimerase [Gaiellaceae bacterium]
MAEPAHHVGAVPAGDGSDLRYRFFAPAGAELRGVVVYLHGIQSHGGWYLDTAAALADRGYATYLSDRRGSGLNDHPRGHFESTSQLVDDARRMVARARAEHAGAPVFLVGGCWGARTAITLAAEDGAGLAGLALVCPALKARVDLSPGAKLGVLARAGDARATVPIPLAPEQFTRQPEWAEFIRSDPLALREVRCSFFLKQALWDRRILRSRELRLPLLLLQAGDDEIVDVPAVRQWFDAQPANRKEYVSYPGLAHILDFEPERERYWDDLAGWLDGVGGARSQSSAGGGARLNRIQTIEILTVRLPFRFSFGHSLAERSSSVNVLVRLTLANGIVGYGEGVPRDYVTGETVEGAVEALRERQAPVIIGRELTTIEDVPALAAEIPFTAEDGSLDTAARCALELALLDAAGKHFGCSVATWLPEPAGRVTYDAVIPFASPRKLALLAVVVRLLGIRQVKLKVGDDLEREVRSVALLRRLLGAREDIRVDANCAWDPEQALTAIRRLRAFGVSCVEQPVVGSDLQGLVRVASEVQEAIIVDESLRTVEEGHELVAAGACDAFNIRVSKCGGLLPSAELARIAETAGLFAVVGAQVGESGILSSAGRHLAASIRPRYLEGSGGSLLLREDVTKENVLPGFRGRARPFTGPGLGITVKDDVVARLGEVRHVVQAQPVAAA